MYSLAYMMYPSHSMLSELNRKRATKPINRALYVAHLLREEILPRTLTTGRTTMAHFKSLLRKKLDKLVMRAIYGSFEWQRNIDG